MNLDLHTTLPAGDPDPGRPGRAVVQVRTTRPGLVPSRPSSLRSCPAGSPDGGRFGWSGTHGLAVREVRTIARTDDGAARRAT